ncbi:hypothetical protein [Streptomyces sp. RKAG293]|uniref:hypothetical protein n=1 Tax=Streptomyces sp. RKAG293 TaxID=2893403 RepID=UPI0020344CB9|nr:hypothetical protein [Streptomyces sp. RKAG293]MCM2424276.1 hypothetical protein [Streptomyces sp. RKAG293]
MTRTNHLDSRRFTGLRRTLTGLLDWVSIPVIGAGIAAAVLTLPSSYFTFGPDWFTRAAHTRVTVAMPFALLCGALVLNLVLETIANLTNPDEAPDPCEIADDNADWAWRAALSVSQLRETVQRGTRQEGKAFEMLQDSCLLREVHLLLGDLADRYQDREPVTTGPVAGIVSTVDQLMAEDLRASSEYVRQVAVILGDEELITGPGDVDDRVPAHDAQV